MILASVKSRAGQDKLLKVSEVLLSSSSYLSPDFDSECIGKLDSHLLESATNTTANVLVNTDNRWLADTHQGRQPRCCKLLHIRFIVYFVRDVSIRMAMTREFPSVRHGNSFDVVDYYHVDLHLAGFQS